MSDKHIPGTAQNMLGFTEIVCAVPGTLYKKGMVMITVSARRTSNVFEFVTIFVLIFSPFLPWFGGYPNGEWVSFTYLFQADAIDAIGNLTYDHLTFSTVLQVGYLQSAIIELTFLICTWGYGLVRLRKILFSDQPRWGIEHLLLWGSILCLVSFTISFGTMAHYRNVGWGYWLNGGILLGIVAWQGWQFLRQRKSKVNRFVINSLTTL